jgi:hypothetical protein
MRALSRLTDLALSLSSRTSLGVAASVDGLLRVSPELIVPIISVTGGIFGSSDVATATTWLLFFTMLYEFAPLAYSRFERSEAVFSRSNREFRFLFAVGGCVSGVFWIRATDLFSVVFVVLVVCTWFAAGGGVIAYLSQRHNWDVLNPEGPAVATLSRLGSEQPSDVVNEVKTDLSQEGWKRSLAVAVHSLGLWTVFGFPIAIAGIVLLALSWMFPIADLILCVWAVSIRVFPRLSVGPERTQLADLTGDLQEFFVDVIEYVVSDLRGAGATLFIFVGIVSSAVSLSLIAPSNLNDIWFILDEVVRNNTAYQQAIQSPEIDRQWLYLLPWNCLGCLILLLIGGASGLWVWIREFKRLPAAAAVWGEHPAEVDMSSPPPRIPGFILLPTVAPATAAFWVDAARGVLNRTVAVYDWVVAVAWPVIVIVTLWTIYKDRRAQRNGDSHSVTHEHWWVGTGAGIQVTSLSPVGGINVAEIVSPIGVFILGVGVIESGRYAAQFDDIRRHADAGYLILMGVLVVAYMRIFQVYTTLALTLSAVCLLGGLVILAGNLIDNTRS